MKVTLGLLLIATAIAGAADAAITVPGANGSDGVFSVASGTTTIDLSQAASGAWDSNSPTAGKGVYDGDKWAVVFHYSSVNIAAAARVVFKNNVSRAPVVWLVSGDVNISGTLDLSGGNYSTANTTSNPQSEPGPGGFGGGRPNLTTGAFAGVNGPGWGPGGAQRGLDGAGYSGPGTGATPGLAYGTASVIPLIGGSGAGGTNIAGAAGGGAILVAATGTVTVNGTILSDGGNGASFGGTNNQAGSGSGGAIRLVADTVAGTGTINALGGTVTSAGADGRIRIEGNTVSSSLVYAPLPSAAHPANPALIWPDALAPSVSIVSVGGFPVAGQPRGQLNAAADVLPDILPASETVVIQTANVATNAQVNLRVAPLSGDATIVAATFVSGNSTSATWNATVSLPPGSVSLQARVEP